MKVQGMTKCTNCDHDHPVSINLPDPPEVKNTVIEREGKLPTSELDAIMGKMSDIEKRLQEKEQKEQEKELKKQQKKAEEPVLPPWQPRDYCPNGSCNAEHKNKGYKVKVTKRCANGDCKQNAPGPAAKCAWCGSKDDDGEVLPPDERFEDLDTDYLKMIPDPTAAAEHDHSEHEH